VAEVSDDAFDAAYMSTFRFVADMENRRARPPADARHIPYEERLALGTFLFLLYAVARPAGVS